MVAGGGVTVAGRCGGDQVASTRCTTLVPTPMVRPIFSMPMRPALPHVPKHVPIETMTVLKVVMYQ